MKDTLISLGCTEEAIKSIAEDTERESIAVIERPFSELETVNGSFSISISFGTYSMIFTLRRKLTDRSWYIIEEGTVNGTEYKRVSEFKLLSFMHFVDSYTYMLVSPYAYTEDMTDEYALALIKNLSIVLKY